MVVVFIGAWGLYNTTEVFPKADYDLVVNPPATVARGDPRARSSLEAVQERLRQDFQQGRISESEARQEYARAAQVASSGI